MAVYACPSCGRPLTIPLQSPQWFHCRGCGARGATPPDLAARLGEAWQWVAAVGFRGREAAAAHQTAVSRLRTAHVVLWLLAAVPLLLTICGAVFGVTEALKYKVVYVLPLVVSSSPLLVFLPVLLLASARLVKSRRSLEATHAAVPPSPGGSPECRICGAELPPASGDIYIDCRFCGADNLVDPGVLRRIGHDRLVSIDEFRQRLSAETRSAGVHAAVSIVGTVLGAVVTPFVGFVVAIFVLVLLGYLVPRSPAPQAEFALVKHEGGRCVTEVRERDDGRFELYSGEPGAATSFKTLPRAELDLVRAASLTGRTATLHECSGAERTTRQVTIVRAEQALGATQLVVREADGKTLDWRRSERLCGLCMP